MTSNILIEAITEIKNLTGKPLDVLDITKPPDLEYARHLAKVVSKLSPLIGNMIEFSIASILNERTWPIQGHWIRQDPGFPDVLFQSDLEHSPGIEIKTWFPLATEITARFKDSVLHFEHDQTDVVMVAWVPEYLIYGKPKVIEVWADTGRSLAEARDSHYHNPPDYLVFEPRDTSERTINLQQTNTNGYKFQGTAEQFHQAEQEVMAWGSNAKEYSPDLIYQEKLTALMGRYPYRLDTNFAKMDRIQHAGLEEFKAEVLSTEILGYTLLDWIRKRLFDDEAALQTLL